MTVRSLPLAALALVATIVASAPERAFAFPEETETQGEISHDLNGVWLIVHHLKFDRPTPKPTPDGPLKTTRIFNVINLVKITHLKKAQAQAGREARAAKQQASIAKAEAIVAKRAAEPKPAANEDGEVEGAGSRVIVPQIPRPPGYDPKIHAGDKVSLTLLDVIMPTSVDKAFQAAQTAETAYHPTEKALALLGSSWSTLDAVKESEYSRIEWKVIAPDFYDQGLQVDPKIANTLFTITGTQGMIPRPGQPNRNIVVYGVREAGDDLMSGTHSRAMMATAPFPIPIEMGGMFQMFKVADLPGADTAQAADEKKEQPGS